MPEDMSEYMPEDMSDRMPEDMSEYMPEDMPDRMPDWMPDRMPDNMPEDMPDRMPEDLPDRMPEDMPDHMPEDMPDRMPNRMSEDMSDRMPEDLPVRKCINVMVGITRSKVILFRLHPETSVFYQRDDQIFHPIGRLGKTPAFKVGKSNIWQLRVRAPVPMVFQAREYFFGGPMYGWLKQCHDGSDMTRTGHFGCSSRWPFIVCLGSNSHSSKSVCVAPKQFFYHKANTCQNMRCLFDISAFTPISGGNT